MYTGNFAFSLVLIAIAFTGVFNDEYLIIYIDINLNFTNLLYIELYVMILYTFLKEYIMTTLQFTLSLDVPFRRFFRKCQRTK